MDIDRPERDGGERKQRGRGFQGNNTDDRAQGGDYESLPVDKSGPGPAKCEHMPLVLAAPPRVARPALTLAAPPAAPQPSRAGSFS
jgi:hypothetical protein